MVKQCNVITWHFSKSLGYKLSPFSTLPRTFLIKAQMIFCISLCWSRTCSLLFMGNGFRWFIQRIVRELMYFRYLDIFWPNMLNAETFLKIFVELEFSYLEISFTYRCISWKSSKKEFVTRDMTLQQHFAEFLDSHSSFWNQPCCGLCVILY